MAIRIISRAAVFSGLVAAAFSLASCAAIDETVTTSATQATSHKAAAVKIKRQSRSYAYTTSADRALAPAATRRVTYHGSAPYICSPSGFGQKSRCFLRS